MDGCPVGVEEQEEEKCLPRRPPGEDGAFWAAEMAAISAADLKGGEEGRGGFKSVFFFLFFKHTQIWMDILTLQLRR